MRFRTDLNPEAKLRKMPGTPLVLENLRGKLLDKYGIMSLSVLRSTLYRAGTPLPSSSLPLVFDDLGLAVSKVDEAKVEDIYPFSCQDKFSHQSYL